MTIKVNFEKYQIQIKTIDCVVKVELDKKKKKRSNTTHRIVD